MAGPSRYHVSSEAAGISQGILKNKFGLKKQQQLSQAETLLLNDAYVHFFELLKAGRIRFNLALLLSIHKYFLGPLYEWAGQVRLVNISKAGMLFAPIKYLNQSLKVFEDLLRTTLPKKFEVPSKVAQKLAVIHNEFNVTHPFREGNGRTIRLFLDLVAISLGYDFIDWSKTKNSSYLKACIDGASGQHENMTKIIKKGLRKLK